MTSTLVKRIFSLLSVVRGYNILILVAAQYLAAIFIFSETDTVKNVILDLSLFFLVLANSCVVAAGYIINNFYDVKADHINRPIKTNLDSITKQHIKLKLYFLLNFLAFSFGWMLSLRAALFFSVYIFGIWFYSHKLKKHPFTGLLSVSILTILPFFSIFLYYKNFSKIIFIHASFLFLIIMIRELIKDLENIKGALASGYKTLPIIYGETTTKRLIYTLSVASLIPIFFLFNYPAIAYMKYYFYFAGLALTYVGIYLSKSKSKNQYRFLHNILKLLLLIGVFSLLFIDKSLILDKVVEALDQH